MNIEIERVFDELVRERGGNELSLTQTAVCRKLAMLLADDNEQDPAACARAIDVLSGLLPPRTAEPLLNLALLTDSQLNQLERLCAIARGQVPPAHQRKRQLPTQTPRQIEALRLAALLDAADTAGDLTDDDANEARNSIGTLLFPLATLARLVPPELFVTATPLPAPEPAMPQPERQSAAANVVPLRRENVDPDTSGRQRYFW